MSFIYHITKKETWLKAKAQNLYNFCTLSSDGFIHCSTKEQYLEVANRLFTNEPEQLLLLEICVELVAEKVVYENLEGGQELYPHIYGPLNISAVKSTHSLKKTKGAFLPLTLNASAKQL